MCNRLELRHGEERSDEAIQGGAQHALYCFAALAMTKLRVAENAGGSCSIFSNLSNDHMNFIRMVARGTVV
jgi:hypothetical protein